jgi:hypothetical protein
MGGVNARAPAGPMGGAPEPKGRPVSPMPGIAVPRLQLAGGLRRGNITGALARGAGPMRKGLRPESCRGALTRGAGPMTNGLRPGSVAGCSCVEAVR